MRRSSRKVRTGLRITLWGLGTVGALLVAIISFAPLIIGWVWQLDHRFGEKPLPAAPDYTLRTHWAAWPDESSPAERRPPNVSFIPQEDRLADAFFLHPTSYLGTEHWVQPMDDEQVKSATDLGPISLQASVFNGCCRVYAPRYCQANVVAYGQVNDEAEKKQIMDVGYYDVQTAFRHFIANVDPDSPIVLGSHSQGSFYLVRLVMEEIEGTPLMDRVVAVYAIGHSLSHALMAEGYQDIKVCRTPTQTGCFITWDAHERDRAPSQSNESEVESVWNGNDYSGFAASQRICVNPITWTTDGLASKKAQHLGGLPNRKPPPEIDAPLPELVSGTISATCEEDERSNWLWVNGDRDASLGTTFHFSLFARVLHSSDYHLFWADIRQNAMDRTQAFISSTDTRPVLGHSFRDRRHLPQAVQELL